MLLVCLLAKQKAVRCGSVHSGYQFSSMQATDVSFLQLAGFQELVVQLLSQEAANERKHAETIFEQVKQQHPDAFAANLLAVMRSSQVDQRFFAANTLHKVGHIIDL